MKCVNCNFESEQDFGVCPVCSAPVVNTPANPVADRVLAMFRDKLFLVFCILISVSCGASLFSGDLPLISILITIFIWIIYSKSQKGIVDVGSMRCVSGSIYASYVINNVIAVVLAVAGILLGGIFMAFQGDSSFIKAFTDSFSASLGSYDIPVTEVLALGIGWIVAAVFVFAAAIMLLFNIIGYRKLHRLAKSAYKSVEAGNPSLLENPNGARNWLWVYGVFSGISALTSISSLSMLGLLTNGCSCAVFIISAILVKKYLLTTPENA